MQPTSETELARRTFIVCHDDRGTLRVTGPERLQWLQGLLTCDVKDLSPGRAAYGLVLVKTGKILSDVIVVATEDQVLLSTAAGRAGVVCEHLDRLLVMEDAEIVDVSAGYAWLAGYGPVARSLLRSADTVLGLSELPAGAGSPGFVLAVPRDGMEATARQLARSGGAGTHQATDAEWDGLRIALGLPRFGVDYDESHTPHQAGLERLAVCWSKGCYVGQEVVYKQDMRGKTRSRLFVIELGCEEVPASGTEILAGDEPARVGEITSAAVDPESGHVLAFARLKTAAVEAGQLLTARGAPVALAHPTVPQ
jgi:tRNA-modifying protein YgfZ